MEKYLFSFGKGSTQCIGISYVIYILVCIISNCHRLAYSELYLVLGRFFRTFSGLETRGRSREELLYNDYFSGFYPEETARDFSFSIKTRTNGW